MLLAVAVTLAVCLELIVAEPAERVAECAAGGSDKGHQPTGHWLAHVSGNDSHRERGAERRVERGKLIVAQARPEGESTRLEGTMLTVPLMIRLTPALVSRGSAGQAIGTASIAGLPRRSGMVCVGPP